MARFVTIWFRHLKTDWHSIRQPSLRNIPFVLSTPDHGRIVITSVNSIARQQGIETGMLVSDARAIFPSVKILDDDPNLSGRLLKSIAAWCIRYTDAVAIDLPDGLILDVSGCTHLWGGEKNYIRDINTRLMQRGYDVRATMADSIGAAWAIAHYGDESPIIESGKQMEALLPLPPAALRLDAESVDRLMKLGLRRISQFIHMPRVALRRRFGVGMLTRLDQALGNKDEPVKTIQSIEPFRERLPCLEPIITHTGIEIALEKLLEAVCQRLVKEGKGIRKAVFSGFRVDNKIVKIEIGTSRATHNRKHLFNLFKENISGIEPALGIELFMLEAIRAEKLSPKQEKIWDAGSGIKEEAISELMDRFINRFGQEPVRRYVPDEHHWPERSYKPANAFHEPIPGEWILERPRPLHLLPQPQPIEVTAPIPDYPPMNFRYLGTLHKVTKADGPERIEPEWWIAEGLHRDYYAVENEEGKRFWLFRAGHYADKKPPKWFMHGFFP